MTATAYGTQADASVKDEQVLIGMSRFSLRGLDIRGLDMPHVEAGDSAPPAVIGEVAFPKNLHSPFTR